MNEPATPWPPRCLCTHLRAQRPGERRPVTDHLRPEGGTSVDIGVGSDTARPRGQ